MMLLYIGGASSGKSLLAEERALKLSREADGGVHPLYYVATMQGTDEESRERINKHRVRRRNTAFITVEEPRDLKGVPERTGMAEDSVVLLECLSNLAANVFFAPEAFKERSLSAEAFREKTAERLFLDIMNLKESIGTLITVSNDLFRSSEHYDPDTVMYLRFLSDLNIRLAGCADEVIEVTAGIASRLR